MASLLAVSLIGMQAYSASAYDSYFNLSQEQALQIGENIWYYESNYQVDRLDLMTFWNEVEPFPSLGIGHFIWPPESYKGVFAKGRFHFFLQFLHEQGVALPLWLQQGRYCPWETRDEFYAVFDSERMKELRNLLLTTKSYQALFMLETVKEFCSDIDQQYPFEHPVLDYLRQLLSSSQGLFILVDYLNFKGSGTDTGSNLSVKYKGQGWGLLQVLETMNLSEGTPLAKAFSVAAKTLLQQRVNNAPNPEAEALWIPNWFARMDSYCQ